MDINIIHPAPWRFKGDTHNTLLDNRDGIVPYLPGLADEDTESRHRAVKRIIERAPEMKEQLEKARNAMQSTLNDMRLLPESENEINRSIQEVLRGEIAAIGMLLGDIRDDKQR